MNDPNRTTKWVLVIGLVVLSLAVLYPPQRKLKGGIDLVGGTSLLYEIDTTGLEDRDTRDLSSRVMRILKDRVDPKGQLNLEWRPVGSTRLEVRLPRPPKAALERRARYNETVDQIQAINLNRRDIEEALSAADGRDSKLKALERGLASRTEAVKKAAETYDALQAAKAGEAAEDAVAQASNAYEEAMSALLATNLPIARLTDVLALPLGKSRDEQIEKLKMEFPSFDAGDARDPNSKLLSKAVRAYDDWAADKADLEDPSDLKRRLRGAGVLEFRILAERDRSSPDRIFVPSNPQLQLPISKFTQQLATQGARPRAGDRFRWFPIDDVLRFSGADDMEKFKASKDFPGGPIIEEYAGRYYVLMHDDPEYKMGKGTGQSSWELRSAYADRNALTGENVVSFALNPRGGQLFGELTGKNEQRQLSILLDGHAISHATIRERITEHCQISGRFTPERVLELVGVLEAGSLPARLKDIPLSEETIGPSLGETNRRHGLQASLWGAILVAGFVIFYYGFAGGGTVVIALTLNLLFTLAIMAMMQATFTLPGIAGLLLSIGMAIDANVLIFERIREERARGVPFKKALSLGYDKAFSAILDGNMTVMITCIILGFVGSEEIKGFAITLGIGITISMFTALTVTRLIFNTLVQRGLLHDFSMRKLIGVPSIDWIGLRRVFWPVSVASVVLGMGLFMYMAVVETDSFFDIEFLGGTSVQVDFKPEVSMTDEDVRDAISSSDGAGESAVKWLRSAADQLAASKVSPGDIPGHFVLTSTQLTGDELAAMMRAPLDTLIEPRDGIQVTGNSATLLGRGGLLTEATLKSAMDKAAQAARDAADRLRGARVQSVGERNAEGRNLSFEIVTVETNRPLVQQAIMSTLGDKLAIQRGIRFTNATDTEMTNESFFVVEAEDHYLSDVIKTDAQFDIRRFRGGVVVQAQLDNAEPPITVAEFEARMREVGLTPEFEQFRTRETAVFPLGQAVTVGDARAYKQFAVAAVDESLLYDDDRVQWTEVVAPSVVHQVQAALGIEKSLSKVVQFAPQIAGQTAKRAILATVLAALGIGAYVWMRFGTREFGLAVLVTVVHDVCIVLGLIAASHWLWDNPIGRLLMIDDFRFDLTVLAAVLTIIGYQLNDTIVVFDRIRETKGKTGTLSAALINTAINQTMSRTILTATLVTLTVIVLYLFGGGGIHGFAYVMLIGTLAGTYSTVAIAVPLLYQPKLLVHLVTILIAVGLIGLVAVISSSMMATLIIGAIVVIGAIIVMVRSNKADSDLLAGQPA